MKTGFIGLGAMGLPMAENLYRADYLHAVWNRTRDKAVQFCQGKEVILADDPAALARECDVLISCVSTDADVTQIMEQAMPGIQPETVWIDCSTIAVSTVDTLAAFLATKHAHFIDAPVSGGIEGAKQASLVIMAGGDATLIQKVNPVFEAIAKQVCHMGAQGNGQATKAVNQIMAAGINQAVSEALAFAEAMQLDLSQVIEVISGGAAGNWFLQHRGANMRDSDYPAGFKVVLHHKDLAICRDMIASLGGHDTRLPVVEMTLIHYQRLLEGGFGDEDISSLFRLKQDIFKEESQ